MPHPPTGTLPKHPKALTAINQASAILKLVRAGHTPQTHPTHLPTLDDKYHTEIQPTNPNIPK